MFRKVFSRAEHGFAIDNIKHFQANALPIDHICELKCSDENTSVILSVHLRHMGKC